MVVSGFEHLFVIFIASVFHFSFTLRGKISF